jgi:hypothetical protein
MACENQKQALETAKDLLDVLIPIPIEADSLGLHESAFV